jgi:hypothetical protein
MQILLLIIIINAGFDNLKVIKANVFDRNARVILKISVHDRILQKKTHL